jgi:hypothetical protein
MSPKPKKHDLMTVLDQWVPDMDLGIVARAASFLDFAARKKPGSPVAWTLVTKRVLGGSRMPNPDTKIVIDMMKRASAIRGVLERDYKRGLENVSGLGVRATVDSDDYAQTQLVRQAKRHESSYRRLTQGRSLVDPKTMKNKRLRTWVEGLAPVFSSHNERLSKLLLPPAEADKTDKKKDDGEG